MEDQPRGVRFPPRCRWLGWGLAATVLYLITVSVVSSRIPVRLLYDGFAPPPPYRWVRAPSFLLGENEPPKPGGGTIELTATNSEATSMATDDGQAILIFSKDAIAPRKGEPSAEVKIMPLDPAGVAPPPQGLRFDGNAYKIEAVYHTSLATVALRMPATVVLRYPSEATEILRLSGTEWIPVRAGAGVVEASLQVYASTDQLGIFVAAVPARPRSRGAALLAYALAVVGVAVIVAGVLLARRGAAGLTRGGRRRASGGRP